MKEDKGFDRQSYFAWKKKMGINTDLVNTEEDIQDKKERDMLF